MILQTFLDNIYIILIINSLIFIYLSYGKRRKKNYQEHY